MTFKTDSFSLKQERLLLVVLAGMQFTHILDFMIMMPLGPQLVRVFNISTHQFGLLLSCYTFTAAGAGLLAAAYVDRYDRRKLMLGLYVSFIVATLCCGLSPNYPVMLITRALAGAFGGLLGSMVQTMVADVIPFERRGKAMAIVMAAFSLSTVAGVPIGLFLASHIPSLGWRAPFFFIVLLSSVFWLIAFRLLPSMTAHMHRPRDGSVFEQIYSAAKNRDHMRAFAFMALIMMSGFAVIPFISLYLVSNVGLPESFLSVVYLAGGGATFFTSQLIGRMSDRYGKPTVFRWLAFAALVPLLITTHLGHVPWWVALMNSTAFFVLISGRIIPGMAMTSAVALPQVRGMFMSLLSSVQMLSAGTASLIAGMIITRNAAGQVEHYNIVGYLGAVAGLLTIWMAGRLTVAQVAPMVEGAD